MPHPLLIVSIVALAGAILAAAGAWKVRDLNDWPTHEATITHNEVRLAQAQQHQRERDQQTKRYLAYVALSATVEGVTVTSDNSGFDGVPSFTSREAAESYLSAYPVGKIITVRISPRDPHVMHLGAGHIPWGRLGLAAFLAFVSIASLGLYVVKS
uniref:DUF3592 domain-containing protein n=1 Tax=Halomonas sp. TaxID=1486246 RepID=UPI00260B5A86|nr:DUF3592 domain-containing protein [Halomonas sp.]